MDQLQLCLRYEAFGFIANGFPFSFPQVMFHRIKSCGTNKMHYQRHAGRVDQPSVAVEFQAA
jgi:hypothetical protein